MTEKNAGSRANNAAESLRNWLPPALVFAVVLLVMFWRLGSYPPYFNDYVDQMIHLEVNKVFDHADISNRVNWYWKDMHMGGAYQSPLYGMVIELGLRLFGLTLFGVRFFPALIEFGALILTFFAFRKYFPQCLLLSFIQARRGLFAAGSGGGRGRLVGLQFQSSRVGRERGGGSGQDTM
jgi:hypothetical protein